ncbi:unnamed protein product [Cuscuta europaea]|uniref:Uncharacterized protein n=1 Tax=Cuscuta europaea TaxID=41803 RepID=A0A9P0ZLT3_CUSEU|nr:unnamed protein product [Cuscuta europaea]
MRAKYHVINFLSHRGDGPKIAKRLIEVYFALFKVLNSETDRGQKMNKKDGRQNSKDNVKDNESENMPELHVELDSQLLSALLIKANQQNRWGKRRRNACQDFNTQLPLFFLLFIFYFILFRPLSYFFNPTTFHK